MHLGTRSPVKEAMFGRRKKDNGVSKEKNDEDELLKQMMMDPVQILEDFGRDPSLMAELAALGGEEALEDTLFASLSVPATAPRKLALGVLSPSSPGFPAEGEGEETGTETNILASDALNTRKGDRASGGKGGEEGREEGGEDLDERLDEDGVLDADLQDELSNDLEMARLQDAVRESKAKAVALKKEGKISEAVCEFRHLKTLEAELSVRETLAQTSVLAQSIWRASGSAPQGDREQEGPGGGTAQSRSPGGSTVVPEGRCPPLPGPL
ncbi:hypothetical protein NSK_006179 [Nannochloropsis salina CCMP1776]|uniref:Uncharacterized protein n=1 Tax=Nannochloropsis salina CCMP1776 TaxID=1027361 RepID=A0A4D9CTK7_9STRA|nr:hypothetical protein NSK_006179 [Nannochloropsis salina CCMP1776]|eukprot:TFJ82500.1 hypothetical protein NSK_006179 [Nannochloropsis salina CCMP1776]